MTDRLSWIEYKGKQLLFYNYKECKPDDMLVIIEKAEKIVSSQPSKSILELIDVTDINYNTESWNKLKKFAKDVEPYSKAAAVVGLSKTTEFMLKAISIVTRRSLSTFENLEDAKNWLIEQK